MNPLSFTATRNRVKFFFLAEVLERGNSFIPGRPHHKLVEACASEPVSRALDLATGTAYTAGLLAEAMPTAVIHGIDVSSDMLRVGRKSLARRRISRVTLHHGDAGALPFADASFDLVTASFGLHEIPTETRARALAETSRVLRAGGRLVFVDLDRPARFGAFIEGYLALFEPAHARDVLGDGVTRRLPPLGFGEIRRTPLVGGMFQLVAARKELA